MHRSEDIPNIERLIEDWQIRLEYTEWELLRFGYNFLNSPNCVTYNGATKETRKHFMVTIRIYISVKLKVMLQAYIKTLVFQANNKDSCETSLLKCKMNYFS